MTDILLRPLVALQPARLQPGLRCGARREDDDVELLPRRAGDHQRTGLDRGDRHARAEVHPARAQCLERRIIGGDKFKALLRTTSCQRGIDAPGRNDSVPDSRRFPTHAG